MKYWRHITTGEIIEADTSPDNGWLWVEVFCTCLLYLADEKCPVHGGAK